MSTRISRWTYGWRARITFLGLAGIAMALMAPGRVATAGRRSATSSPVIIVGPPDASNLAYAHGYIATARNTPDALSYIGCRIEGRDNYYGTNGVGYACAAADANGRTLYCSGTNAAVAQAIGTIDTDSYMNFYVDVNGKCVFVYVGSYSMYEPKTP